MGAHVMTALADLTGVRVMMMLTKECSSRISRVVFKGTRTPLVSSGGKMFLTTCCWAATNWSMLAGLTSPVAAMLTAGQQQGEDELSVRSSVVCAVKAISRFQTVLEQHQSAVTSRRVYQLGDQRGVDRAQVQLVEECLTRSLILQAHFDERRCS